MTKYTPMIEQYLAIKSQVPDAFLFFRLGDFYEMFFEDAIQAARELEITLTARDGGGEERIPMCGVPYHSAENYIVRLIEKGFKVAICEQVEDPAEAKGIVKREIVRIVTPGTVMESKLLGESANNYIVAIVQKEKTGAATPDHYSEYGLVACDLSTGELYVTRLYGGRDQLFDEINVYKPAELIGEEFLLNDLKVEPFPELQTTVLSPWKVNDEGFIYEHFDEAMISLLPDISIQAISLTMSYLAETQKRALSHIKQIRWYESNQYMVMDPFTRRNLELVETVRDGKRHGSLLWLLDETVTSMGARRLRRWIEKPLLNKTLIEERLEAVEILYNQLMVRDDIRQSLKNVYDLERLVARISYGNANARDLLALRISLEQIPDLIELCRQSGSQTLIDIAERMDPCEDLCEGIAKSIVDEPPVSIRDGGMIREGYHEYLDQLREASTNGKRWIAELEQKERELSGIKSLKIGFNKVFGYYIEVTRSNVNQLPEGRYERKQTLANAERYITPELKEKEALILEAQEKMIDLETELFLQLREKISRHNDRLQQLADLVATVDVLQSFATVSATRRYKRPTIEDNYDLDITGGRHPVVEAVLEGSPFIANDTSFMEEGQRITLITGPNMAGKSTYMRQVAIICIMAQIGCFVPADVARIPLTDRIFTRIGAADDLVGGQSTFMVEMRDIQVMTAKATPRSLVIIDELGRGTSTAEGMAIAQAVIEHLHDQVGCRTLVSTHFHELAHLEDHLQHLHNYCMAVKESGEEVTFLRKLISGAASTSYGIYCARLAGLPEPVIGRAYELLTMYETRAAYSAGIAEAAVAATSTPIVQLSLFDDGAESDSSSAKRSERRQQKTVKSSVEPDPKEVSVAQQLRSADLINMTPLQALNFIHELRSQLSD